MALVEIDGPAGGIATMTLNRPEKRNALSTALRNEMADAFDSLAGDESLKVVVLTGAGDVFSAGFDLSEFKAVGAGEIDAGEFWAASDRWHQSVLTFPLPTIAAVNGPALAGGFDLAVMCDIRVAADTARFAHPEYTFGDVVYTPLLDLVGSAVARELCFTGRSLDAHEALRLRLVSCVVPRDEVLGEARRFAEMVTGAPREVLARTKAKALRRAATVVDGRLDV